MEDSVSAERLQISETVRAVNSALVDADTRAGIERAVCERLVASELYVFAWVGEHDPDDDAVHPRTAAGVEEGYLDDIEIAVHEEPTSAGPTATAIRTGEIQVVQNIREDPDYGPWREPASERGYSASAAVPLGNGAAEYGVLNVYTDRPRGFAAEEREVFAELGDTVTTAIEGIEAKAALRERKAQYERLAERISDGFYAVDTDWRITYWNEQMATRTGVAESEVLGERLWDAFPALEGTENERRYREAMRSGEATSFEAYLDDPFDYWVAVDVYPDDDGLSVFSREITERKEYEKRLEAVIQNTSNAIYIKNLDGEYELLNDAAARLFGVAPEEAVGQTDADLFDAESAAEIREVDSEILASGEGDTRETTRYIDGREHVFIDNKFPYRDGSGDIVGIVSISHDITGRKARERDLQKTKRRLDLALEGTNTGVWERDLETGQVIWNESMERLFGLDPGSFDGTYEAFRRRVHPEDLDRIEAAHRRAIETDEQYEAEYRIERADGEKRWVRARGQVRTDEEGHDRMVGILTDITERKERERELEEQQQTIDTILSNIPAVLFTLDENGVFTRSQGQPLRDLGLDRGEIVGESIYEAYADQQAAIEGFERALEGDRVEYTTELDGRVFDVVYQPLRDDDGAVWQVIGFAYDVTERKQREERLREQNEKLEVLNRIVRHDIRNDMQIILTLSEVLAERTDGDLTDYATRVLDHTEHAIDLTRTARDLMETVMQEEASLEPTPLARTLEAQLQDVRASYDEVIVRTTTPIPRVQVLADDMLTSVFRNVLKNAVQHNDADITEIEVAVTEADDDVTVAIADNGPGVPDERKASVFGKGEKGLESEGTGIGLYLVHSLVESYGGEVWVDDREGDTSGAVFRIRLPKA